MGISKLEEAKRRTIRQAIQSNLEGRLGKAHQTRVRRQIWRWSSASLLSASVLLTLIAFFVPRGKTLPTTTVTANPAATKGEELAPARLSPNKPVAAGQLARLAVPLPTPGDLSMTVLPLSVKRIVIDPGHGGKQSGAISDAGTVEKDVNLDIALRLRKLLQESPFEVALTRASDQTMSLADRVAFANSSKADLFVSIHINWMEPHSIRPLETFYVGPSRDPKVLRLAQVENRDSGLTLSEYHELLEKVFLDTRREESQSLAKTINAELLKSLRQLNPNLQDRGVKMAPFAVLLGTQMPAALAEVSSLSNREDDRLLRDEQYRQQIAAALFRGIVAYANSVNGYGRKGNKSNGKA
jgi:N-acetylmuramoyl-L-alanine amidase